jgi:hypothetical protein
VKLTTFDGDVGRRIREMRGLDMTQAKSWHQPDYSLERGKGGDWGGDSA